MILPTGQDDTDRLRSAIAALPDRGILTLKSLATYFIDRPIYASKRIWIRTDKPGKPATLHCRAMAENWMAHLVLEPKQGPEIRWSETLKAGQRPKLALVGKYVCGYGVNPHALHDPAENHYRGFSDDRGLPEAPRDIQGESHWARELLTSCDGSIIEDLRFTSAPELNLDYALGVSRCRGVIIRNVSFDTRTAINITDSQGVSIEGVSGKVNAKDGQQTAGRILSCWQTMDLSVRHVNVECSDRIEPFMAEAWCDGLSYEDIRLRIRKEKTTWPPAPAFFSNGGCRNQVVRSFDIDGDLYLTDCGGAEAGTFERPIFERGRFTGKNLRPDIVMN